MSFKNCFALFTILLFTNNIFAQVGVGTSNPTSAAMLEVSSQDNGVGDYKGFMFPRVPNVAARDAINASNLDQGLLVYVVEKGCLQMFNGIEWINVSCKIEALVGTATQNFETTPSDPNLPIYSETGSVKYTTEVEVPHYPNTDLYVSEFDAFGVNNGTASIILGPLNLSGSIDATFRVRLAGFALSHDSNGMDNTDTVKISISTTGPNGAFTEELLIMGGTNGSSNNNWGFEASRSVTTVFSGSGIPTSFTSGAGNNSSTGGISLLEITGIPNSNNVAVKIELLNNKANELWVIDDAQLIAN